MIAAIAAAAIATAPTVLSDIKPIPIHPGMNIVAGFAPSGGAAQIVRGWRGNGNAHGYNDYLVLTPKSEGRPLGVVSLVTGDSDQLQDFIRDDPFDGERKLGVLTFARARVNGRPASLLIIAHLDETPDRPLADHDKATVRVFQLVRGDGVGETTDVFRPIAVIHTAKMYCNAELALRDSLGTALPEEFAGQNRIDGCWPP